MATPWWINRPEPLWYYPLVPGVGSGTQGYPESGSYFEAPPLVEGSHFAWIYKAGGSFSQTITLPADGVYSLSYYVAGRQHAGVPEDQYGGSMTYEVRFGAQLVATDSTTDFQDWTLRTFSFTTTAGSQDLTFVSISVPSGASTDQTSLFDAVSVTAVPEPTEYVAVAGLALLAFGAWRRSRR